jgi:hypothetical protein
MERMINGTNRKDDVIDALIKRKGLIQILDGEGEDLLIDNYSNPDKIRNILYAGDEEEEEVLDTQVTESKKIIKNILRS